MRLLCRARRKLPIGFSPEAIKSLGSAGLLGIMLPADIGGSVLGPRTFAAIVSALAEADASVAWSVSCTCALLRRWALRAFSPSIFRWL